MFVQLCFTKPTDRSIKEAIICLMFFIGYNSGVSRGTVFLYIKKVYILYFQEESYRQRLAELQRQIDESTGQVACNKAKHELAQAKEGL